MYLFFLTDPVRDPMAALRAATDLFWMLCPCVRCVCDCHSKYCHDFNVLRFLPESLREREAQLTRFHHFSSYRLCKDDE